ncbi:MAG: creatininase family protein [Chloroflexi bacterium]|nr:creatininase family protein [Chloroflexota bacterium]
MTRKVLWQEMRRGEIEEVAKAEGIPIVPVGSIEQHGPHLPLNTDICDAWSIAQRAAERSERFPIVVAPPIWWGVSPYHMGFPGTISLRPETLDALIVDVCTSIHAHGFAKIVLLNGHGGNFLQPVVTRLTAEGVPTAVVTYWDLMREEMAAISQTDGGSIGHSGEMETSLQLFLQPHLVATELIGPHLTGPTAWPARRGILAAGFGLVDHLQRDQPTGVAGDPTAGTAAKGEQIVEAAVRCLLRYLEAIRML